MGDDHWTFRFRGGGAFRRGGCRGLRASSRYRLLFLLRRGGSGSLGRASPRTDGEGRGQGDGKRDQDEPQDSSLAFTVSRGHIHPRLRILTYSTYTGWDPIQNHVKTVSSRKAKRDNYRSLSPTKTRLGVSVAAKDGGDSPSTERIAYPRAAGCPREDRRNDPKTMGEPWTRRSPAALRTLGESFFEWTGFARGNLTLDLLD